MNSNYMHRSYSTASLGPEGLDLSEAFFSPIHQTTLDSPSSRPTKVTFVGAGNVGMAIAQAILTQDLADVIALIDSNPDKLRGEMLDLQHAAAFLPCTTIVSSPDDFSVTRGSDICIVTAGALQNPGESRLNLLRRNVALFRKIIPPLAKHSPDHIQVNAKDVQVFIVGEHGDSSVALWPCMSVGGVPVLNFLEQQRIPYEKETLEDIHKAVVDSTYEVIRLKGYTSWAIGYSVASLVRSILRDQRKIHPVTVLAKGFYENEGGDVFLSLPALLGRGGVLGVTNVHMTDEEVWRLRSSAGTILEVQSQLNI